MVSIILPRWLGLGHDGCRFAHAGELDPLRGGPSPHTSGFQRPLGRLGGQPGSSRLRIVAGPSTPHLWVPADAGTTGGSAWFFSTPDRCGTVHPSPLGSSGRWNDWGSAWSLSTPDRCGPGHPSPLGSSGRWNDGGSAWSLSTPDRCGTGHPSPLGSSVRWNDWAVSMVLLDSGSLRDRPPAHLWVPASAGTTGGSAWSFSTPDRCGTGHPHTSGFQRPLERLGGQPGPSRLRIVAGHPSPLGSSVRWNDWGVSLVLLGSGSLRDTPHLWVPASAGTTGGPAFADRGSCISCANVSLCGSDEWGIPTRPRRACPPGPSFPLGRLRI